MPPSKLPMPVFARQVMVVFGAEYLGTSDKVAWRYGFTVDGVPCMLESAKWGIRLHVDAAVGDVEAGKDLAARVIGKLAAAQRTITKSVLAPQLADQIQAGNVTIINQFATFSKPSPATNSLAGLAASRRCFSASLRNTHRRLDHPHAARASGSQPVGACSSREPSRSTVMPTVRQCSDSRTAKARSPIVICPGRMAAVAGISWPPGASGSFANRTRLITVVLVPVSVSGLASPDDVGLR